jgi:glycogen debranching enzyme
LVEVPALRIDKTEKLSDPYFVAGEYAYLLGAQDGSFPDLGSHVKGEMGGLWAPPIKLIDGLWLRVDETWLTGAQRFISGPFWNEHVYQASGELMVTRRQFVPDDEKALVVRYTFRSPSARTLRLRLLARSDLQGEWLSSSDGFHDGFDHAGYDEAVGAWICRDDRNAWYAVVGGQDAQPRGHESGRELWGAERTAGQGISVALDYEIAVVAGEDAWVEFVVAGSDAGLIPARESFLHVRDSAAAMWEAKEARYAALLARSALDIPDKTIGRAWDWVKCNYQWLVRTVPPVGRGLGAGVPEYPWWFGCDNAYALRGCLALGQHEMAIDTLDLLRSVSVARNGDSGRVIHECNTRGYTFNPGNIQETPHFARAIWDTFLWTGDLAFLRRNYAFCKRGVLEWTLGTNCPDGDVLPYGYGIIEIEHLNLQCIDSAALTVEALTSLGAMAEVLGEEAVALRCRELRAIVQGRLEEAFWIDGEGLYGDMVATPAEMAPRLRVWLERARQQDHQGGEGGERARFDVAAQFERLLEEAVREPDQERKRAWLCKNWTLICPLEAGLTAPDKAARLLARVESPEFSGPWGMYLSGIERRRSMSIATGVLAVAELRYGRVEQALGYIRTIAKTLDMHMPGAISEMSPDYGCCVQAWSGYGVAWPLVTQVFGVQPDAFRRRLALSPTFPGDWPAASLRSLRVGSNVFDIAWDGSVLRVVSQEPGWTVTADGTPLQVEYATTG